MRITLFDSNGDGHHTNYAAGLAKGLLDREHSVLFIGPKSFIDPLKRMSDLKGATFCLLGDAAEKPNELKKAKVARSVFEKSEDFKSDIVHFLYLDRNILSLIFLLWRKDLYKLRTTLHWAYFLDSSHPSLMRKLRGFLELNLLAYISRRGVRVIVHSKVISDEINAILPIEAVDYAPYPTTIYHISKEDRSALRNNVRLSMNISEDTYLILIFGGTRFDKGADLAVEAINELPSNYHLLVVGKEESFSKNDLIRKSISNNGESRLHFQLGYLPDENIPGIFVASDIVLLPYRKIFAGQSGPLTIAAALGIPVVASDVTVLRETISKYDLGVTFPSENVDLMIKAILKVNPRGENKKNFNFVDDHSLESFLRLNLQSYQKNSR